MAAGLAFSSERAESIDWLGAAGAILAVAGFAAVVFSTVLIWRPTEGRFVHDAGVIIGSYVEGDPPMALPALHRELALWLGRQTESNRRMLELQLKTFTWGLAALLVEMVGVILALGDVARG